MATVQEMRVATAVTDSWTPERQRLLRILSEPEDIVLSPQIREKAWSRLLQRIRSVAAPLIDTKKVSLLDVEMLALALWETCSTAEHLVIAESGAYNLIEALRYDSKKIIGWDIMHRLIGFLHYYAGQVGTLTYDIVQRDTRYSLDWLREMAEVFQAVHDSQREYHQYRYEEGADQGFAAIIPTVVDWHARHLQKNADGLIAAGTAQTIHDTADGLYVRMLAGVDYVPHPREWWERLYARSEGNPVSDVAKAQFQGLTRNTAANTKVQLYVLGAALGRELNNRYQNNNIPERYPHIATAALKRYATGLDATLAHGNI